jgi:hypothetical protein
MIRTPYAAAGTESAFRVSFTYDDALKAQAVVRELVTGFSERNVIEVRDRAKTEGGEFRMMAENKIGENLEVLEPASLPETPDSPNRPAVAAVGLARRAAGRSDDILPAAAARSGDAARGRYTSELMAAVVGNVPLRRQPRAAPANT